MQIRVPSSPGGNERTAALSALFDEVKKHVPSYRELKEKQPYPADGRIRAISYTGENCGGRQTEVFAYLGFPENAGPETPVPAMVLIHGGGGHAYASWVRRWVDRGYAAISFDGFGQIYGQEGYSDRNEDWILYPASHMPMDGLSTTEKPFPAQWYYHYVADAILAHNLLRADPRVKTADVGVTGISWGGFCCSTLICYDDRFAFAAPVYGCGFLDRNTTVWGRCFGGPGISDTWDGSLLLENVTMPVLFVNRDDDPFFCATATAASAAAARNGAPLLISGLGHSQDDGSVIPEIFRFADETCGRGPGNPVITNVTMEEGRAILSFTLPADADDPRAFVYYRAAPLEYEEDKLKEPWLRGQGRVEDGRASVEIPEDAAMCYFIVTCKAGTPDAPETLHAGTGIYVTEE